MLRPSLFIREWRSYKKLSQEELAQRAGLSQEIISTTENGKMNITLQTMEKIASALQISAGQLFERPDDYQQPLDRFHIDRVARSIVLGKPLQNELVKDLASLMSQKLNVHNAPGKRIVRGIRWDSKNRSVRIRRKYGDAFVRAVIARTYKFL